MRFVTNLCDLAIFTSPAQHWTPQGPGAFQLESLVAMRQLFGMDRAVFTKELDKQCGSCEIDLHGFDKRYGITAVETPRIDVVILVQQESRHGISVRIERLGSFSQEDSCLHV